MQQFSGLKEAQVNCFHFQNLQENGCNFPEDISSMCEHVCMLPCSEVKIKTTREALQEIACGDLPQITCQHIFTCVEIVTNMCCDITFSYQPLRLMPLISWNAMLWCLYDQSVEPDFWKVCSCYPSLEVKGIWFLSLIVNIVTTFSCDIWFIFLLSFHPFGVGGFL